jgi:PRC-barrel domain
VSIQGNISIGMVDDIVFSDDGYIEYLIVQNEGKLVTVPWEAAKFNFQERTATVSITQERFREIPTYATERYPEFYAPAYRPEIYKYYGLTPRQERRIERKIGKP